MNPIGTGVNPHNLNIGDHADGCMCGRCKAMRIPDEVRAKIIADQKAKGETSIAGDHG